MHSKETTLQFLNFVPFPMFVTCDTILSHDAQRHRPQPLVSPMIPRANHQHTYSHSVLHFQIGVQ